MATPAHARVEMLEFRRLLSAVGSGTDLGAADATEVRLARSRQPAVFALHGPAINAFPGGTLHSPGALFERTLPLDQYSVTIDWGDGSTSPGQLDPIGERGAFVNGSHEYAQPGVYTLTLVVQASDGSIDSFSQTVIPYARPMAVVHDSLTSYWREEGLWASYFVSVEPVTIQNADMIVATIDWGDGTMTDARRAYNWFDDGEKFSAEHLYTEAGTYTVTFTAAALDRNDVLQTLVTTRELTVGAAVGTDANLSGDFKAGAAVDPQAAAGFRESGSLAPLQHGGGSIASELFRDGDAIIDVA